MTPSFVGLHGFWGEGQDWSGVQNELLKQSPKSLFWFPDLRTKNGLGPDLDFASWSQRFNFLTEDRLPNSSRILMGYSMGGRLALHAAVDRPQNWMAVVLISAHHGFMNEKEREEKIQWHQRWENVLREYPLDKIEALWSAQPLFVGSKQTKSKSYSKEELSQALRQWSVLNHGIDLSQIQALNCPLLWIVGGEDLKYVRLTQSLRDLNISADALVVPKAGHRLIEDQGAFCAQSICRFLRQKGLLTDEPEMGGV